MSHFPVTNRLRCRAALFTLGLIALTALGGCTVTFKRAVFNQGDGVRDASVLIVPFSELPQNRWYGESKRGNFVASALKSWVGKNHEQDFPDSEVQESLIDKVYNWPEERISSKQWKALVAKSGIDYVVVGDLKKVQTNSEMRIGILDALAEARYRVIDARAGREIFTRTVTVILGNDQGDIDVPILDMGSERKLVEKRLLTQLGAKLGKELYGYYTD